MTCPPGIELYLWHMQHLHKLVPEKALEYIVSQKSLYTIVNNNTGNRFTFKTFEKKKLPGILLVSVLTGSNNMSDYKYLGYINKKNYVFKHSDKSSISSDAQSFKAFEWVYDKLRRNQLPDFISVLHHNHCGACGRLLTTDESIKSGFGPYCRSLLNRG